MWSPDTRMFLAARSRWTKPFLEGYSIPDATCWQNLNSICWSALEFWDSLLILSKTWHCAHIKQYYNSFFFFFLNILPYLVCSLLRNVLKSPLDSSSSTIIVYACTVLCVSVYIMCVCMSMYLCVCIYVCIYVCVQHMYVCVCVCVRVCMHDTSYLLMCIECLHTCNFNLNLSHSHVHYHCMHFAVLVCTLWQCFFFCTFTLALW